jgi:tryptophan synthase alpha subunit
MDGGLMNLSVIAEIKYKTCFSFFNHSIEDCNKYVNEASKLGLATPFLASPNTSESRLRSVGLLSSGFLYVVSVYGITGCVNHLRDIHLITSGM